MAHGFLHFWRLTAIGAIAAAAACTTPYAAEGPIALAADDNGAVAAGGTSGAGDRWTIEVKKATRRVEPYLYAQRQADLRATLLTPRLRQVFGQERARFHGRFAQQTGKELLSFGSVDEGVDADKTIARPESEEQVLIFVAFYVADQKHRDLGIKGTIWDTTLVRGDKRVKPIAIESVRHSPAVAEVFPYVDRFDDLYLLRFPLVDPASGLEALSAGGEPLRLEINSALAQCAVSWGLEG
jgi:hypothetical protein